MAAGAFFQCLAVSLLAVVLRILDPEIPAHSPISIGLAVIVSVLVGWSIVVRLLDMEPFKSVPKDHPLWDHRDYRLRNVHPVVWGVREYLLPFDWLMLSSVLWWLLGHRSDRLPMFADMRVDATPLRVSEHIVLGALLALSFVYTSTLVDRYFVRPRIRGGYWNGALQCIETANVGKWTSVTKVWLLHRLVAQVGVFVSLAIAVSLVLRDLNVPIANPVGGAVATLLGGLYLARIFPVVLFILNPSLAIGDSVELAEEFTVRRQFPLYFVVDVSLEGIKLFALKYLPAADGSSDSGSETRRWSAVVGRRWVTEVEVAEVAGGAAPDAEDSNKARTHDRVLNPSDAGKLLRNRDWPKPCLNFGSCAEVNRHCPIVRAAAAPQEKSAPVGEVLSEVGSQKTESAR